MPGCKCHRELLLLNQLSREELECEEKIIDHGNNVLSSLVLAEQFDHASPELFKLADAAMEFILKQLRSKESLEAPPHGCSKLSKYKRQIRRYYNEYKDSCSETPSISDYQPAPEEMEDGCADDHEMTASEPAVYQESEELSPGTIEDAPIQQCDEPELLEPQPSEPILVEQAVSEQNNYTPQEQSVRIIRLKYRTNTEIDLFVQHRGVSFSMKENLDKIVAQSPEVIKNYIVGMKARGRNLLLARRPDLMALFTK